MIRAIPLNSKKEQNGKSQVFTPQRWEKMKKHFGRNLAWREIPLEEGELGVETELIGTLKAVSKKQRKTKTT